MGNKILILLLILVTSSLWAEEDISKAKETKKEKIIRLLKGSEAEVVVIGKVKSLETSLHKVNPNKALEKGNRMPLTKVTFEILKSYKGNNISREIVVRILGGRYSTPEGKTYVKFSKSFATPSIVYQKDTSKGYAYIITWLDSDTKNVKYAFANDSGDDLVTYQGPFVLSGSQTLSSPSIAINKTGDKAVIVYKQEIENGSTGSSDRIIYAEINTTTGVATNENYLYNKIGGSFVTEYSKSVPIVLWKQEWENYDYGRFIIFWSSRNDNTPTTETLNWELKYAISDENNANFSSTTTQKAFVLQTKETNGTYKKLYNFWMPMAGTCDFEANDSSNLRACMLFFNEIFPNSTDMDYHKLTRVFITRDPYNSNKLLVDKNKSPYQYYRYSGKYNYGHLSVTKDPSSYNAGEFIVTFMNAGKQSFLSAFEVRVDNYGTNGYDTTTDNMGVLNQNYKLSRTGFAGVLNESTNKIRFTWLVE